VSATVFGSAGVATTGCIESSAMANSLLSNYSQQYRRR
jgi:hypothetical protein